MLIIPAIDLKGGQCVRLKQGRMDDDTVYSSSPGETAKRWASEGAERIHIVDLDGAFSGKPENMEAIRAIRRAVDIELDLGGGIRDEATATRLLEEGLDFVILGTAALESPELVGKLSDRFPGKVLVGIDANDGMVAVRGWADVSKTPAVDLAADLSDRGAAGFIFTDIARDGMQTGVNVEATAAFARAARGEVIASGGLNDIEGVRELLKFEGDGITGVITGRAIYEGTLDLAEAIALTKGAVG
ncbi:MAG: 1-(5-phosphoribosyl)-5-[(5-phosphoribosylamino)methylideneamino]imidazole-4-carboxamide isomerase [Deltaproteobacteria bacterium]|nr:MAG: 1-(5-phosphoribosyl)-5-[(5-phosphoribosylamino)methylideneamino]imidazole-4-carboxamide isomerase [Deltaproteobacteria bacterium]